MDARNGNRGGTCQAGLEGRVRPSRPLGLPGAREMAVRPLRGCWGGPAEVLS